MKKTFLVISNIQITVIAFIWKKLTLNTYIKNHWSTTDMEYDTHFSYVKDKSELPINLKPKEVIIAIVFDNRFAPTRSSRYYRYGYANKTFQIEFTLKKKLVQWTLFIVFIVLFY